MLNIVEDESVTVETTMQLPDDVYTIFTGEITEQNGGSVITVPERELRTGQLDVGGTYRIAILPQVSSDETTDDDSADRRRGRGGRADSSAPPVDEGDRMDVEIEDIGEQGDGIARIGPGYVVFVSDTDIGDRVTIEITEARENFSFAEVIEHEPVSD